MAKIVFPIDYNVIRAAFANKIQAVTGLDQNRVILLEPEQVDQPRPKKPYFGYKFLVPGEKSGDDSKQHVSGSIWNSGGVRKMTIQFDCYGQTHEESYNYMALWQTALDLEDVQEYFRKYGIAVWVIGNVADLSALLNTAFEGRAQMDCTFGIAMNLQSDLGSIDQVTVDGTVTTDGGVVVETEQTVGDT